MKTLTSLMITILFATSCNTSPQVQDFATPFTPHELLPSASDVSMRSLRFRPMHANDPNNTFEALEGFHVTRLDWTYLNFDKKGRCLDEELVKKVIASGRVMGGSGSGPHSINQDDPEERQRLGVLGLDGKPLIPMHKRNWANPPVSGCMNNPELLEKYIQYVKKYIDAGVNSMQRDEPATNGRYGNTGLGCYCSYCVDGFREYLSRKLSPQELRNIGVTNPGEFDYRKHLLEKGEETSGKDIDWSDPGTIRLFVQDTPLQKHFSDYQDEVNCLFTRALTDSARAYARQKGIMDFTYSCNNTSFQEWSKTYYHPFDFALSELMLSSSDPGHIYRKAQEARALGKIQVFGSPKSMGMDLPEDSMKHVRRRVISTAYASGGLASVPWDVFEQSAEGGLRYFGKYEDYADLFGFVRASHDILEGYATAGADGFNIGDDRYPEGFPVRRGNGNDSLCIFLRTIPGDKNTPVAIHLVDWSENPSPSVLRIRKETFSTNSSVSLELRLPAEYDKSQHAAANAQAMAMRKPGEKWGGAQAEAYMNLIDFSIPVSVDEGDEIQVILPAMKPWGILVIR